MTQIIALSLVLCGLIAVEIAYPSTDIARANEAIEMATYADFCPN
jgi:hypothetical protein